jgi:preprotein translocase subunit YajC
MPQDAFQSMLIPYAIIIGIFYFLVIRPQRKQQKKLKEMLSNLKKNDDVVTSSGIHGSIVMVKDKTVIVLVDKNCSIEFDREAIVSIKDKTVVKPEVVK